MRPIMRLVCLAQTVMKKDPRVYLAQILERIDRILKYTAEGKEAFFADPRTQDAVIRNFEVIGEADGHPSSSIRHQGPLGGNGPLCDDDPQRPGLNRCLPFSYQPDLAIAQDGGPAEPRVVPGDLCELRQGPGNG
jgi:hypothetical protein